MSDRVEADRVKGREVARYINKLAGNIRVKSPVGRRASEKQLLRVYQRILPTVTVAV